MGKKTHLDADQRAWLAEQLEDALYAGAPPETAGLAAVVAARVVRLAQDGDGGAQALLESLAMDGMENRAYLFLKQDRTVIPVPAPKPLPGAPAVAVKETPSRAGLPVRDEAGSVYWQQRLWWEMTWERFALLLERIQNQARRLGERERGLSAVLRLRERHPGTATPGEACALENIDPRSLGLHELAG